MTYEPQVARFLKALDETQYLAPDRLQAYQRRLLSTLVRHARSETDFYADRLAPIFRTDDTIDWDRWQEIPILTRSEAQENFATMAARSMPLAAGKAVEDSSSGSTGRPLRHLTTDMQKLASTCCSERFFQWHGLKPDALTARIRATAHPEASYPLGRTLTGWRIAHANSQAIDLSIATTTDQQLEWLHRVRPRSLASYPSNLRDLARVAEEAGARLHLDAILTYGEMIPDDTRAAIHEYFGLAPLDRYGASEVGHIAAMCRHSHKLHVAAELVFLEIVDEDGGPADSGIAGRVIVTSFYNLAMPLIRYDLGDYGVLSAEPCGCRRTLPVLERVLGRTRNIFRFADGSRIWPVLLSRELQTFVPNRQFQVVQHAPSEVEFRYVPVSEAQTNDLSGLSEYVRKRLHPCVTVTATAVGEIKRSAAGKFEDCVSLVAA